MLIDSRCYSLGFLFRNVVICLSLLTLWALPISSQKALKASAGIAWNVKGSWHVEGKGAELLTGDAVKAGSLLMPASKDAVSIANSITVLLPDGQLILYECFTSVDCARGFRVPSLFGTPESRAVNMLTHIREGLSRDKDLAAWVTRPAIARLPRDEAIAAIGPDNRVHIEGLAARLSNGHYTYDVRPLDRSHPRQFRLVTDKDGSSVTLALPAAGVYFVTITDSLNTPRIDLFVAAVEPSKAVEFQKSYRDAAALMKDWNTYYLGWPVHDFQRAYLESLVAGENVPAKDGQAESPGKLASNAGLQAASAGSVRDRGTSVTAEPAFSPKAGLYDHGVAITLQCRTPGATIHFTLDGSQAVAGSPVYRAPILLKATALTIKAFATSPGKKDSAVVTGIFRIPEQE
jgi:hypothetical protein